MHGTLVEINGMQDHIHLLIRETKSVSDQDFVSQLKGESSRWINRTFTDHPRFAWQSGYGWFSVSARDLDKAINYIRNQKEHHRTVTFQDEYRKFLMQYKVDFLQSLWATTRLP